MRAIRMRMQHILLVLLAIISLSFMPMIASASPGTLGNSRRFNLEDSGIDTININAADLLGKGILNQQHQVVDQSAFLKYINKKIYTSIVKYPAVRGYGLYFVQIKLSSDNIKAIMKDIEHIKLFDGSGRHFAAKVKQLGFRGNSITSEEVPAVMTLLNVTPQLEYLDIDNNKELSHITPLLLKLDGIKNFHGVNTRGTHLSGGSTFYLLRSVLQNQWMGLAISIHDIYEANAVKQVLKRAPLKYIGLTFDAVVGKQAISELLGIITQKQKDVVGLHLGFDEHIIFSEQDVKLMASIIVNNKKSLRILEIDTPSIRKQGMEFILNAMKQLTGLYALGVSSNYYTLPQLKTIFSLNKALQSIGIYEYVPLILIEERLPQGKKLCHHNLHLNFSNAEDSSASVAICDK